MLDKKINTVKKWAGMSVCSMLLIFSEISGAQTASEMDLPAPQQTNTLNPHTHKTAVFDYNTINTVLWPIVTQYTAFPNVPAWYSNSEQPPLPIPDHTHFLGKLLTLRDAIWIALRNNPSVKGSEAQRILDKFGLALARWNFQPQFTDSFAYTKNVATGQITTTTTGNVSLNTPFGTNIQSGFTNNTQGYFDSSNGYSTTVTQPFMNGGWLTQWNNYLTAVDSEIQQQLTFKQSIMTVVTTVISNYMQLISDYNSLRLTKIDYDVTQKQLKQDQLQLQTGRMSRSAFLQEQVTAQNDKLQIVEGENSVQTSYQTLLTSLGLVSTAKINIDQNIDTTGFEEPSMQTCIDLALRYNPAYLQAKLNVDNAQRALTNAINGLMPTLTASGTFDYGSGQKTSPVFGVNFSVPIDDMNARSAHITAKVDLENAKIALTTARQEVISNVITQWKTVQAAIAQIKIGQEQVAMQLQVVKNTNLLLHYGRTTMFEYLQQRNTLLTDAQSLVSDQTSYINAVATLDNTMGTTLDRWNIKLRY